MIVKDGWNRYPNHQPGTEFQAVLHDLHTDPCEMNNLIGAHIPDRDRYLPNPNALKEEMTKWLAERNSGYVSALKGMTIE